MIQVDKISYTYPKKHGHAEEVLHQISCIFEAGKLYAITGKSGSGKTTLLSLLAGLYQPCEGSITVDGVNLTSLDQNQYRRDKVSIIYQSLNLFPLLTVSENIMYPMRMNRVCKQIAREKTIELLNQVELKLEYADKFPDMLSGGEQQRVAIARALGMPGKIILADEPTGNLDSQNTRNIVEILRKLAHESKYCVIIVTHDIEIAKLSDVVYSMRDGKII